MRAIDVHVHPSLRGIDRDACAYFKRELSDLPKTEAEFAAIFSRQDVQALLLGWHSSTASDGPRVTNEYVLDLAQKHPESFPAVLASLDMSGEDSRDRISQAQELVKNSTVKGFKFHPPEQSFYPNDPNHYELWELMQAAGKPVMFHTGFTVLGAGFAGGKGIGLDFGRPIHLDTLAKDFPRMKIIAAHPGWPWQEELVGVLTHKKNVYVDTSGYLAEQLPEIFRRAIGGRLQDKALFGTDYPYVDLEKALISFEKLGLNDAVKEKILVTNAQMLFAL
jgi:predicted TIM-barrel fold metal-dependent hydrolase